MVRLGLTVSGMGVVILFALSSALHAASWGITPGQFQQAPVVMREAPAAKADQGMISRRGPSRGFQKAAAVSESLRQKRSLWAAASETATSDDMAMYDGVPPSSAGRENRALGLLEDMIADAVPRVNSAVTARAPAPSASSPRPASAPPLPGVRQLEGKANSVVPAPGTDPTNGPRDEKFTYLEIQVSHSAHELWLIGNGQAGQKATLHHCRVGLGSSEFPTPVGIYFVTHIYDDDPWWIPPTDRAWAAGESPSRKVYGGTMAPLLKKRPISSRKQQSHGEDFLADNVKLDDYGYRFHGTNSPRSIGHNQSHGCVRMLPQDARAVANLIKEHIGAADRQASENGTFVVLRAPVRLNLIK